jgi:6-phosphogluconate dehydrogenase
MQLGMIGLGRMGANMSRRLARAGHVVVAFDPSADARRAVANEGVTTVESVAALAEALEAPRAVWLMVPHHVVDTVIDDVAAHLSSGDTLVDGGNSHYAEDPPRARRLAPRGIDFVDVGTSGGIWGAERGYCLMIGGPDQAVSRLDPIFRALAPDVGAAPRRQGRGGEPTSAERGYFHCGAHGAGHFVKMVHNGIEYGLMAAYAEGFNLMKAQADYQFDLPNIAELWRRGSVVGSWLLDLTAAALDEDPGLEKFAGRVGDSGEGRWATHAAIDAAVPVPVLAAALFSRFSSRGGEDFSNRLLSAMRAQFGGHVEPA